MEIIRNGKNKSTAQGFKAAILLTIIGLQKLLALISKNATFGLMYDLKLVGE